MSGKKNYLLIILMIVTPLALSLDPSYTFDQFMVDFERNYTPEQKAIHKTIFDANYASFSTLKSKAMMLLSTDFLIGPKNRLMVKSYIFQLFSPIKSQA